MCCTCDLCGFLFYRVFFFVRKRRPRFRSENEDRVLGLRSSFSRVFVFVTGVQHSLNAKIQVPRRYQSLPWEKLVKNVERLRLLVFDQGNAKIRADLKPKHQDRMAETSKHSYSIIIATGLGQTATNSATLKCRRFCSINSPPWLQSWDVSLPRRKIALQLRFSSRECVLWNRNQNCPTDFVLVYNIGKQILLTDNSCVLKYFLWWSSAQNIT